MVSLVINYNIFFILVYFFEKSSLQGIIVLKIRLKSIEQKTVIHNRTLAQPTFRAREHARAGARNLIYLRAILINVDFSGMGTLTGTKCRLCKRSNRPALNMLVR